MIFICSKISFSLLFRFVMLGGSVSVPRYLAASVDGVRVRLLRNGPSSAVDSFGVAADSAAHAGEATSHFAARRDCPARRES